MNIICFLIDCDFFEGKDKVIFIFGSLVFSIVFVYDRDLINVKMYILKWMEKIDFIR